MVRAGPSVLGHDDDAVAGGEADGPGRERVEDDAAGGGLAAPALIPARSPRPSGMAVSEASSALRRSSARSGTSVRRTSWTAVAIAASSKRGRWAGVTGGSVGVWIARCADHQAITHV
jgi:hypothetical protein